MKTAIAAGTLAAFATLTGAQPQSPDTRYVAAQIVPGDKGLVAGAPRFDFTTLSECQARAQKIPEVGANHVAKTLSGGETQGYRGGCFTVTKDGTPPVMNGAYECVATGTYLPFVSGDVACRISPVRGRDIDASSLIRKTPAYR